jgi:hypothetical protein
MIYVDWNAVREIYTILIAEDNRIQVYVNNLLQENRYNFVEFEIIDVVH